MEQDGLPVTQPANIKALKESLWRQLEIQNALIKYDDN